MDFEKLLAELDQSFTLFSRTYPSGLYAFFTGCKEQGFTEEQAMRITLQYLQQLMPNWNNHVHDS